MNLTRKPTGLGGTDDWCLYHNGKIIGRIYRDRHNGADRWRWFVNFLNARSVPGLAERGEETTLEAALTAFKGNFIQRLSATRQQINSPRN